MEQLEGKKMEQLEVTELEVIIDGLNVVIDVHHHQLSHGESEIQFLELKAIYLGAIDYWSPVVTLDEQMHAGSVLLNSMQRELAASACGKPETDLSKAMQLILNQLPHNNDFYGGESGC